MATEEQRVTQVALLTQLKEHHDKAIKAAKTYEPHSEDWYFQAGLAEGFKRAYEMLRAATF